MLVNSFPDGTTVVQIEPSDSMVDVAAYSHFDVRDLCKAVEGMIRDAGRHDCAMGIARDIQESEYAPEMSGDDRYDAGFRDGVRSLFQSLVIIGEYLGESEGNDER